MTPERFTEWREALGGRRFLLTIGSGIVSTILRVVDKIDISAFVTLVLATIATYIAGRAYVDKSVKAEDPK